MKKNLVLIVARPYCNWELVGSEGGNYGLMRRV